VRTKEPQRLPRIEPLLRRARIPDRVEAERELLRVAPHVDARDQLVPVGRDERAELFEERVGRRLDRVRERGDLERAPDALAVPRRRDDARRLREAAAEPEPRGGDGLFSGELLRRTNLEERAGARAAPERSPASPPSARRARAPSRRARAARGAAGAPPSAPRRAGARSRGSLSRMIVPDIGTNAVVGCFAMYRATRRAHAAPPRFFRRCASSTRIASGP
jgi:hypothetical protein